MFKIRICQLLIAWSFLFSSICVTPQEQTILKLTTEQFEALFLKQNLQLIAEQMNIDIADAAVIQARLWDNPELSINSVNLWSTDKQREGEDELIPPLFGSFAKNTQFSVELSQIIQTANKRAKLVRREKIAKDMSIKDVEEVFRGLKIELKKTLHETCYLQSYIKILQKQSESLEQLIDTYRRQVKQGNIARSELLRLQSSLLETENEINETQQALNEYRKTLKSLINANPLVMIELEDNDTHIVNPADITISILLEQGIESRPDMRRRQLTTQYHEKSLAYEKSLRIPDITFSANYDRFGGVWKDFIGFGISFDIPFLNRNQGNIKSAKFLSEQSRYLEEQQQKLVQNEIIQAYDNYRQAYLFFIRINEDDLLPELDGMLDVYTKNLLNKNINMLEFIDFMDTYKSNKEIVLTSEKNVKNLFAELQYVTAMEIK